MNLLGRDEGYTLIETVVGLTLLLGVILPLTASFSMLLLGNGSNEIPTAHRIGKNGMSVAMADENASDSVYLAGGYRVTRAITRNHRWVEITVVVHFRRDTSRILLTFVRSQLRDP